MVLPVGVPDGEAVGEEVGGDALREEEEVDDVQVHVARHVGGVPDEVADEREEREPKTEDDERDEVVDLLEEAHEPPDLHDVVLGDRLVEAVADGRADTELGEGEEAEDVPEESVDAEVALGEEGDERRAVGEPGNDIDNVAECPDAGRPEHARRAALAVEHHDASFPARPKRRATDGAILSTDGMLTCQPLKMKKTAAKMQTAAAR